MASDLRIPAKHRTVPGTNYRTPKEVWGFRTAPGAGDPAAIAREFLRANAEMLGLPRTGLRRARTIASVGATHVIFSQSLHGHRIHRAYVTVHVDDRRRVYLVKNRAVPAALTAPIRASHQLGRQAAAQRARRALAGKTARLKVIDTEEMWYPKGRALLPAYRVRVHRKTPTTRSEEILFIHAVSGTILSRYDNLANVTIGARLFDPHPLARVADWHALAGPAGPRSGKVRTASRPATGAYRSVTLRGLPASRRLDTPRVSTRLTPRRVRLNEPYREPSHRHGFEEVMAWYHLDAAIRYVESLGYRGDRRIFREPILVNARGTTDDNSWYSPGLGTLTFGTGGVDDAEDGETILHEFGHALQDAICPGFGQSAEAAAMGEGFGDYLAGSFFADRKPASLRDSVMSWDAFETSEDEPPRLRPLDSDLTYENFDHASSADEHENGVIWATALWAIRALVGRAVADRIIVESHFQLDGYTTFARGARAIIDADRHLFGGRHVAAIREVFHRRGIGPVD